MENVIREPGKVRIKPAGDIVASTVPKFKQELIPLVEERPGELIIDLVGVEMIDSLGLGVMIAAHNSVKKAGGKIVLVNASRDIQRLFNTMRLDRHFTIMGTGV